MSNSVKNSSRLSAEGDGVTDTDLLPCPFCGGEPVVKTYGGSKSSNTRIMCISNKGHLEISTHYLSRAKAIKVWNTRKARGETTSPSSLSPASSRKQKD